MDNLAIAQRLTAYAHQLDERGGQLYRARAYRRAAVSVAIASRACRQLYQSARTPSSSSPVAR